MILRLLFVGLGGFLGAIARYLISGWSQQVSGGPFPVGTLLVNVLGSFFLGFLAFLAFEQGHLPVHLRLFFLTGLLGAFTTYSTFSYETFQLMREGLHRMYMLNIFANTFLCITGAWLGFVLANHLKG